ncbi:M14 family zinc carboxypeptidase [Colwellia hornerae]|nr:M14 family zinc carboxypeptidase [Colwellia hornerae]
MLPRLFLAVLVGFFTLLPMSHAAKVTNYLPTDHTYNQAIPTPESSLGFGIGERHIRHDQLLNYIKVLASSSERITLTDIGQTQELRQQVLLTVSSKANLANLNEILAKKSTTAAAGDSTLPLVIWLGYSVHGDEISGANAAMVVAYHLAASENADIKKMLENTLIVIEPSINPDGMDRFVQWANMHRGSTPNADPNHIEHHQGWLTGRTNHFGFDLNRDWLLLAQKESQNRLAYFHQYQPHVLGDFHEMGANNSYFFQPGIPTRTHPLTPSANSALTKLLATFHAAALDKSNRLYFSEENFDDFYYGKGSTYPDINGGVGILFEQASSRGMQQNSDNGLLTFEFGIQNHVLTSLSTIEGAWQHKAKLLSYQKNFYKESEKLANKESFSGYLLHETHDLYRLNVLLDKLKQHQIKAYPLTEDFRLAGVVYAKEHSVYVPLDQRQYRVVQALFSQQTQFEDNTFYDVSGWTMPLAMDIDFYRVGRTWGLKLADNAWEKPTKIADNSSIEPQAYAYAFEWHHFLAPKLLNDLLNKGIKAKVATKPFSSRLKIDGKMSNKYFARGSIIIPAGIQTQLNWRDIVTQSSQEIDIPINSLSTGLTVKGIDIGSGSLQLLAPVKVLMLGGKGVSQYESAEMLFYLDDTLSIPVTVVEQQRLAKIELSVYSHIIMVDGKYDSLGQDDADKIAAWIKSGGVIFGQKRGAKFLSEYQLLAMNFVTTNEINQLFDTDDLRYQDKDKLAGRKRIAGAIFESTLDTSHPLAYGYTDNRLPLFRNSTLILQHSSKPFISVANYNARPLLSGYADKNMVNRVANSAAIVAHDYGNGRVIASTDNLAFRGYWLGSAKLIANSLFFAKAFSASATH